MRIHPIFRALIVVSVLGFLTAPAHAELTGAIRGVVTDPSGAVIPRVKLKATNILTGISSEMLSSNDGSYEFLHLQAPADYSVTAQANGFRNYEVTGIHLTLNQIFVFNITMEVGTVTQTVVVEAASTQVEQTSMQLGADLSSRDVTELPLIGRDWINLQQTLPGTTAGSDRFGGDDTYATNGSRSQFNSFLMNGTDTNDLPLNTPTFIASPDSIGEVHIITDTINPEYGRNSGAIMNAVTKSGTNQIHGDGFDFFRDTGLNARNFFSPTSAVFHQNLFGGTVGGPIWKDHTFFFFSYQGDRVSRPEAGGDVTVFTADQRNGIFPDIATTTDAAGNVIPNPTPSPTAMTGEDGAIHPAGTPYGTLFPTGHIPQIDLNKIALNLMNAYVPNGNVACGATCESYQFNPVEKETEDQEIIKIDHTFSPKDSIWGYSLIERFPNANTLPFSGASLPGFGNISKENFLNGSLAWTHTFGGSSVNEARFGYNRFNFVSNFPQKVVLPSTAGFSITPQQPQDAGLPYIGLTGYFNLGFSYNGPQPRIDQTYDITDNFSKILGRHTLKMGFDMRRFEVYNPFLSSNNGNFTFGGAGVYSTSDPGADFLLGIPDSYAQNTGDIMNVRAREYYSYFQDQFKLRNNLTLTYGLGWQIDTPLTDLYHNSKAILCWISGQQSTIFPTAPTGLDYPGDPGCTPSGTTTKPAHFAPRFGFAWSPDSRPGGAGKTSIRGGFGVYFNRAEEELTLQNLGAPPWGLSTEGVASAKGLHPSFANPWTDIAGGGSVPNPFPYANPSAGDTNINFANLAPFYPLTTSPDLSDPYAMNYNVTVERELRGNIIASVGWVGSLGRKLQGIYNNNFDINPTGCLTPSASNPLDSTGNSFCVDNRIFQKAYFPQFSRYPDASENSIYGIGNEATFLSSNYNSLQATLNKRTSHGLSFLAAYTWAHTLDYSSSLEDDSFAGLGLDPTNMASNYGNSGIDARQRLTLSYVYDFPKSRWAASNWMASRVVNGWEMSGITTLQSGFPVQIYDSTWRELRCDGLDWAICPDRPNQVGRVLKVNPRTSSFMYGSAAAKSNYYFDPNAFALEPFGTVGDVGRNPFSGPGINNFNWSLMKNIKLVGETKYIQLRFEFYNIWNHTQFQNIAIQSLATNIVNGNAASSNFGRVSTAFDPRLIQLAAKIYF